ncbi:MAG: hypothetical protein ACI841_002851 [Planctomycetota bacterium]|jgi:hypothetical protein
MKIERELSVFALLLLGSCGAGAAAVVGATSGNTAKTNADPALVSLRIFGTRTSPAVVEFNITDPESDATEVELTYLAPDGTTGIATLIEGDFTEPTIEEDACSVDSCLRGDTRIDGLATSPDGTRHLKLWDFAADPGLGEALLKDINLQVRVGGGTDSARVKNIIVDLGNDAPTIDPMTVGDGAGFDLQLESSGIVRIPLRVLDSSEDDVEIRVQYRVLGEAGCELVLARDAELGDPDEIGPDPQVDTQGGLIDDGPSLEVFFWATDFTPLDASACGLKNLDREVELIITAFETLTNPDDAPLTSETLVISGIRIDNNEAPVAALGADAFTLSGDERLGIAVPVTVLDPEADHVSLALQWTLEGSEFPSLDGMTAESLAAAVRTPSERLRLQLATEISVNGGGLIGSSSAANRVRLPELAIGALHLHASQGVIGRTLDILGSSTEQRDLSEDWEVDPLVAPVAAIPNGDGISASVLDVDSTSGWVLTDLDLTRGISAKGARPTASGNGVPTAVALSPNGQFAIVASMSGPELLLHQVERKSAAVQSTLQLSTFGVSASAMIALDPARAVAVVGNEILEFDLMNSTSKVLAEFTSPIGIVQDPSSHAHVYVSDSATDTITRLNRINGTFTQLPISTRALEEPGFMAVSPEGRTLFVEAKSAAGRALYSIPLGEALDGSPELCIDDLPAPASMIATGAEGLILMAHPLAGSLSAVGGIEQRRQIISYDPETQEVSVDEGFSPELSDQHWQIQDRAGNLVATEDGIEDVFIWDSGDLPLGGPVLLRIVPFDEEIGLGFAMTVGRDLPPDMSAEITSIEGAQRIVIADANHDGLLDLVNDNLSVHLQTPTGEIPSIGEPAIGGQDFVVAADIQADGDMDFLTRESSDLAVKLMENGLNISTVLLSTLDYPKTVLAADLDRDGDQDLVVAEGFSTSRLTIFEGTSEGFASTRPTTVITLPSAFEVASIVAIDLGGPDSSLEIVASMASFFSIDSQLYRLSNEGGRHPLDYSIDRTRSIHISDGSIATAIDVVNLDSDGVPDIVIAYDRLDSRFDPGQLDQIRILRGGGDFFELGLGTVFELPSGSPTSVDPLSMLTADINGDGKLDIVTGGSAIGPGPTGTLAVTMQRQDGGFDPPRLLSQEPVKSLAVADIDGDGRVEIVTQAELHRPARPGLFDEGDRIFDEFPAGEFTQDFDRLRVGLGDVDKDGLLDVFISESRGDAFAHFDFHVLRQTSPARFGAAPLNMPPSATGMALAMVNGDSYPDLVLASSEGGLRIVLQSPDGDGQFEEEISVAPVLGGSNLAEGPKGCDLIVHDFDADGQVDVAVAQSQDGGGILLFLQPDGGFKADSTPDAIVGAGILTGALTVEAADINGDGRMDLISGTSRAFVTPEVDEVLIFLQPENGFSGAQTPSVRLPGGPFVRSIVARDLDADGRVDLTVLSSDLSNEPELLWIFKQSGEGALGFEDGQLPDQRLPSSVGFTQGKGLVVEDFDEDGRFDIAVSEFTSPGSGSISIYLQGKRGDFSTAPDQVLSTPFPVDGLVGADVDGDGTIDLVAASANQSQGEIRVFYGSH